MGIETMVPGLVLMVAGLLLPMLPRAVRPGLLIAAPVLSFAHMWSLPTEHVVELEFLSRSFEIVRVDKLSRMFGIVFHIAAFLCGVFAAHLKDRVELSATMIYAGAAIAAVFAGDLVTLFIFWELTAVTSVLLIFARRTDRAFHAGMRYLGIQVASGLLLLAGTLLHFRDTGSLAFGNLGLDGSLGHLLIFLAFGIKAAFPLLHNWLQDAYPEATPTGTVVLSSFTTKMAIYALARSFAGTEVLVYIGTIMVAFPIFFAVIVNDLRRVLCYSVNNQLGYMVVGIGIGTELAINGAVGHAFADIIFKGLLFMSMGAVLLRTGTCNGSDLGGLYKTMPWTTALCCIGAASISAFPLFSGFVTKSMIMTAAAEEHHTFVFLVLLFGAAGVFHHSGIKIPFFAFFGHDSKRRVKPAPLNMRIAMGIAAVLCILIGVLPSKFYSLLPFETDYNPYSWSHVVTQMQLLMASAMAFSVLMRWKIYPPELHSVNLDTDVVTRRLAPTFIRELRDLTGYAFSRVRGGVDNVVSLGLRGTQALHQPPGELGEPWTAGKTTLWSALFLAVALLLAFYT